jgi:hypothetical protein
MNIEIAVPYDFAIVAVPEVAMALRAIWNDDIECVAAVVWARFEFERSTESELTP